MNTALQKIASYKSNFVSKYGFCADPDLPIWKNLETFYLQLPSSSYFARNSNRVCHNYLPPDCPAPIGVEQFLGLGLKYCVQTPRPSNNLSKTFARFANDVRRISFFTFHPPDDDGTIRYIPKLYIKSDTEWRPSDDHDVEQCLLAFERSVRSHQRRFSRPTLSNLLPREWRLSNSLKENDTYIVVEADKNLGACLLLRETYIQRAITEHLGNTSVYQRLSKTQAFQLLHLVNYQITCFCAQWRESITPAEHTFLLESTHRFSKNMAKFRMSLKAHKTPWKMRPIVCCAGTSLNNLSRWLDYWLQQLKFLVPTYLKNSTDLLTAVRSLGDLPPGAKLFTADANSMYTNIDTDHALSVISRWLELHQHELPKNFPLKAVLEAMALVMRHNVFEFGDLYFLQLLGTAMGTSAACMWATLYFGIHEVETLLPRHHSNLLLLKRYIDDMFGVWVGDDESWQRFQADTNNFGILTWEFEAPSTSVDFLDLTLTIEDHRITTKTFQKRLNLYQYIMPSSNHSPRMMKGIIFSLVKTYFHQNSHTHDYLLMCKKLFQRHVNRGWDRSTLKNWILDADRRLRFPPSQPRPAAPPLPPTPPSTSSHDRLFLHFEYHKHDIPKLLIRRLYDLYCQPTFSSVLGIRQLTIAYSRPKNVKELVSKARLYQRQNHEASKYYEGELPTT